uniref:NABP n=1 Tax=Agave tequilana vitivirus 1 TaxID=2794429 RepID=A0A7T5UGK5_9VIRU|nr:NABP [Agave tequilana vitivirus 1]
MERTRYMGESRSAAKRRAKRWGVCYCCGRLECNKYSKNKNQTKSQAEVYSALREPATRYLPKVATRYISSAIQHQLDDLDLAGISLDHTVRFVGVVHNGGVRSPEETPWAYKFGECNNEGSNV